MMVITIPDNDVQALRSALVQAEASTRTEMSRLLDIPEWTDGDILALKQTRNSVRVLSNAIDQLDLQVKMLHEQMIREKVALEIAEYQRHIELNKPVETPPAIPTASSAVEINTPSKPTLVGKIQSFTQRVFSQCKQSLTNKKKETQHV